MTPSPSATWSTCRCPGITGSSTGPRPPSSWAGSSRTWRAVTSAPRSACRLEGADGRVRDAWLVQPRGPVPYGPAYDAMHELADLRTRGEVPDTLILLEHTPVYTAGRRSDPTHILWAEQQ